MRTDVGTDDNETCSKEIYGEVYDVQKIDPQPVHRSLTVSYVQPTAEEHYLVTVQCSSRKP